MNENELHIFREDNCSIEELKTKYDILKENFLKKPTFNNLSCLEHVEIRIKMIEAKIKELLKQERLKNNKGSLGEDLERGVYRSVPEEKKPFFSSPRETFNS